MKITAQCNLYVVNENTQKADARLDGVNESEGITIIVTLPAEHERLLVGNVYTVSLAERE
jgi:hypothetical protein